MSGDGDQSRAAVVITGAARGIGQAIARRFAADQHPVIGIDLLADELDATIAGLPPVDVGHLGIAGSAVDAAVLEEACQAALERGGLSVFVANAGVAAPGASVDYPLDEWDRLQDLHLRGAFAGAVAARRHMQPGGSIVLMSSINAQLGFAGRAAYSAAKAGVEGLVRSLAAEWAPEQIRVNAVAPGTVETPLQREFLSTAFATGELFLSRIPMGRFGRPEEVADAVRFLGSDQSSYITGHVLPVDGGWRSFGVPGA